MIEESKEIIVAQIYPDIDIATMNITSYNSDTNVITYDPQTLVISGSRPIAYEVYNTGNLSGSASGNITVGSPIRVNWDTYGADDVYQVNVTHSGTITVDITYDPELANPDRILIYLYGLGGHTPLYSTEGSGHDIIIHPFSYTSLYVYNPSGAIGIHNIEIYVTGGTSWYSPYYSGPCSIDVSISNYTLTYTCNGEPVQTGDRTLYRRENPGIIYTLT